MTNSCYYFYQRRFYIELRLINETNTVVSSGDFLSKLFNVYHIKKSKFAKHIGYENANLHALLKGRRKFNSKLAMIMGQTFNIDPEIWLFIDAKNELKAFSSTKQIGITQVFLNELSHNNIY